MIDSDDELRRVLFTGIAVLTLLRAFALVASAILSKQGKKQSNKVISKECII